MNTVNAFDQARRGLNDDVDNEDEPLLPTEAIRAMYRRGLDLAPGASVALTVLATDGCELTIVVRNASEGFVEASCRDTRACDALRMLVGFRVTVATLPRFAARPMLELRTAPSRTPWCDRDRC